MAEGERLEFVPPHDEAWQAFVASLPDANIFHATAWMDLLNTCYGYRYFVLVSRDAGGSITAGLPFMDVKSWLTGRRWVALPFSDYCTPLAHDAASLERWTDALVRLSQAPGTPWIEVRWALPARQPIAAGTSYVLHRLPLCPNTEQVGRALDSMHRQNIRAARRNGVRVEYGADEDDMRRFYTLHLETRRRKGMPVQPWRFFRLLHEKIICSHHGFVLLAYQGDTCLAGGVFLHWGESLMCKYAASREDTLDLRPNNLLFWTGICWGCEHGYRVLDFGRTDLANTGLREFKTRWGAVETPLVYSMLGGRQRAAGTGRVMKWMQAIIRRSPPRVASLTGELLYRHVG